MLINNPRHQLRILKLNISKITLFPAGSTSAFGEHFPDHERNIPGNPEISEVFLARLSLISDILGYWLPSGRDHSITFLTVYTR
jgi:hypothetical protein